MDVESSNLQNEFLNAARRDRVTVTIFLANGKKLVGRIKAFDKFTVLLDGPFGEQIVFKHAISTVSVSRHGAHAEDPWHRNGVAHGESEEGAAEPS